MAMELAIVPHGQPHNNEGDEEYEYRGQSTIGVVYTYAERGRFSSICPEYVVGECISNTNLILYSSTRGLLLWRNPRTDEYIVQNPFIQDSAIVVNPPFRGIPECSPHVLVVNHSAPHLNPVFHIVFVLASPIVPFSCRFCIYSSRELEWLVSPVHLLGPLIPETGISVGVEAFWLKARIPAVVSFNVVHHYYGIVNIPNNFWDPEVDYIPQLGRWGDALCLIIVTEINATVWSLGVDRAWIAMRQIAVELRPDGPPRDNEQWIVCQDLPVPLRFQSCKFQVLLWDSDSHRLIIWEDSWADDIPIGVPIPFRIAIAHLLGPDPDSTDDLLPHICTILDPRMHFPPFDWQGTIVIDELLGTVLIEEDDEFAEEEFDGAVQIDELLEIILHIEEDDEFAQEEVEGAVQIEEAMDEWPGIWIEELVDDEAQGVVQNEEMQAEYVVEEVDSD